MSEPNNNQPGAEGQLPKTTQQAHEILYGGRECVATFSDGRAATEVKVLKVPRKRMPLLAQAWGKQDEELAIYCDRPADWVEALTDDCALDLWEVGRELNESFFGRWLTLSMKTLDAHKELRKTLGDTIEKSLASIVSERRTSS